MHHLKRELNKVQALFDRCGNGRRVVWSDPFCQADIESWERKSECLLPPSYRSLVAEHGVFCVGDASTPAGANYSRFESGSLVMLPLPDCSELFDREDLDDLWLFQYDSDSSSDDYYAFDPLLPAVDGELRVVPVFHDDVYERRFWADAPTFGSHIEALVRRLLE
ncbi:MAG: hypothetical protein ACPG4T_07785 [Nannocystaceae bacterium]